MQKHLHVHRKNEAITFQVKMLRLNHVSQKKYKYYPRFAKHTNTIIAKMYLNILPDITEMYDSRFSCIWPSFSNFGLCRRRCLDLLWLG